VMLFTVAPSGASTRTIAMLVVTSPSFGPS
jgi:hypothetical protein